MPRYGSIHRVVDFIARSASKRTGTPTQHVQRAISYLQTLDTVQEKNPAVTVVAHAGDGIWVYYNGRRLFQTHPHTSYFRFIIWPEAPKEAQQLAKQIDRHLDGVPWFEDISGDNHYCQWRAGDNGIALVEEFVKTLPYDEPQGNINSSHPRTFLGEIREQVLSEFEANGCRCPGVPSLGRKPHKVDMSVERVVYDHVLPYSRGGDSSLQNVQVMCAACNARKAATAR